MLLRVCSRCCNCLLPPVSLPTSPVMPQVELPAGVKQLLDLFSVAVSFGVVGINSVLQCLDMGGYVNSLALHMAVPLALALLLLIMGALGRMRCNMQQCTASALLEKAAPALLKLAFLVYPLVTNIAFDAFSCYEFTDDEWLKADVAIQCHTQAHDDALTLAWAAIIIYPVGLLLVNAALYSLLHAQLFSRAARQP